MVTVKICPLSAASGEWSLSSLNWYGGLESAQCLCVINIYPSGIELKCIERTLWGRVLVLRIMIALFCLCYILHSCVFKMGNPRRKRLGTRRWSQFLCANSRKLWLLQPAAVASSSLHVVPWRQTNLQQDLSAAEHAGWRCIYCRDPSCRSLSEQYHGIVL